MPGAVSRYNRDGSRACAGLRGKTEMAAQIIVAGLTCLADALMLRAAILVSPVPVGALLAPVSKWTAVVGCAVIVLGVGVAA
jgi:hypothetical protein